MREPQKTSNRPLKALKKLLKVFSKVRLKSVITCRTNKENFDAISTNFRTLSEELASRGDDISKTISNVEAIQTLWPMQDSLKL